MLMSVSNFLEFPATTTRLSIGDRRAQVLIGIGIAGWRMTYAGD